VKATSKDADVFEGRDRKTGKLKWTGTRLTSSSFELPTPGLGGSLRM